MASLAPAAPIKQSHLFQHHERLFFGRNQPEITAPQTTRLRKTRGIMGCASVKPSSLLLRFGLGWILVEGFVDIFDTNMWGCRQNAVPVHAWPSSFLAKHHADADAHDLWEQTDLKQGTHAHTIYVMC